MTDSRSPIKLKRVRNHNGWGPSRYWHPHGWVIFPDGREWRLPRGAIGGGSAGNPKRWWTVKRHATTGGRTQDFPTLHEARAWCDEHEGIQ